MSPRRIEPPQISFFAFQDVITSVVGIFLLFILALILQLAERQISASQAAAPAEDLNEIVAALEQNLVARRDEYRRVRDLADSAARSNRVDRENEQQALEATLLQLTRQLQRSQQRSQQLYQQTQETLRRHVAEGTSLRDDLQAQDDLRQRLQDVQAKIAQLQETMTEVVAEDPLIFAPTQLAGRDVSILDVGRSNITCIGTADGTRESWDSGQGESQLSAFLHSRPADRLHLLVLVRPSAIGVFERLRPILDRENASYGFDVIAEAANIRLRPQVEATP